MQLVRIAGKTASHFAAHFICGGTSDRLELQTVHQPSQGVNRGTEGDESWAFCDVMLRQHVLQHKCERTLGHVCPTLPTSQQNLAV